MTVRPAAAAVRPLLAVLTAPEVLAACDVRNVHAVRPYTPHTP
ncbi:hypothetical protein [Actinomadura sp. WMMB 499]|nr:hypothetical protein [Actinomadura sp. WMMB 499]